ncbi:adenylate/guanylate cyclase domain-containing protein [candidate division KSB1 bacterium]|nr:adenylate/guanylate cyclase domain-containing protein [candidate division KSB1 bacterium]
MLRLFRNKEKFFKIWGKSILFTMASILIVLFLNVLGIIQALELKTYDMRFKIRGDIERDRSQIVIVKIDDQTFSSLKKRWPFPRSYYARIIENLNKAGARLVVFDIEFSENSSHSEDEILADIIAHYGNIIVANKFVHEINRHDTYNKYLLSPIEQILKTGVPQGHADIIHDHDGFLRRYILFQNHTDLIYFPLSIEVLKFINQIDNGDIDVTDRKVLKIGKHTISKYSYNTMLINYFGDSNYFHQYSFSNILDDATFDLPDDEDTDIFEIHKQEGTFEDKIVLIGVTAEEFRDTEFTPFFDDVIRMKMPGVIVHAHALNTILNDRYIKTVSMSVTLVIMILLAIVATILSRYVKPFQGFGIVIMTIILMMVMAVTLFSVWDIWMMIVLPVSGFILSYGLNTLEQVITERREKGIYRKTFEQYVAPNVVKTMLDSGNLPKFGGERRTLTVLFSDIRSFTTFSEKYQPEVVVNYLSNYLSSMVDVIFKHQGTLDKFVGDEIMALFGAPYYFSDHAEKACLTALDMVQELRSLQWKWSRENQDYFHIGIGINTGRVIVGNLGSYQLFDYTVIGDEVNLGARLEGANKYYATTILMTEFTYQQVEGKAIVRRLDRVRVQGKLIPVMIYELRGMYSIPSIEKDLIVGTFEEGRELFEDRRYRQAMKKFRLILRYFPFDGPSRLFLERCTNFIQKPPADDWDGVFNLAK